MLPKHGKIFGENYIFPCLKGKKRRVFLSNNFLSDNIICLSAEFLQKSDRLQLLSSNQMDKHFCDAGAFLADIFKECIWNQNDFECFSKRQTQQYKYSKGVVFDPLPEIELTMSKPQKKGTLFECAQRPKDTQFDFEYAFDEKGRLIREHYNGNKKDNYQFKNTTYFLYADNFQIGINFNCGDKENESINGLSLSEYKDNRLYRHYGFSGSPNKDSSEYFAKKNNIELYYYDYKETDLNIYFYNHFGSAGKFGRKTFLDVYQFTLDDNNNYHYLGLGEEYTLK